MPALASILGPLLVPVARKLAKRGASKLAAILLDGPAAETVAGPIVERIFSEFEIPLGQGEEMVAKIDDLLARDGDRVGEILDDVTRTNTGEWVELWKMQVQAVNDTIREEQTGKSVLTRIWRPVFGLGFTAVYVLLGLSFVTTILTAENPLNGLVNLSGLIMAFVGSGAAVLGVQVWSRGEEKKAGVA